MGSWYGVVGHSRPTQGASVAHHHVGVGGTVITSPAMSLEAMCIEVLCVCLYRGPEVLLY